MKKFYIPSKKRNLRKPTIIYTIIILFILLSSSSISAIMSIKREYINKNANNENELTQFTNSSLSNCFKNNCDNSIDNYQIKSKIIKNNKSGPFGKYMFGYAASNGPEGEGTYRFDIDNPGEFEQIGSEASLNFLTGGTWTCDEKWLAIEYGNGALYEIDVITGELSEIGGGGVGGFFGLAYNPQTNTLYACSSYDLIMVDPETGDQEVIGPFNTGTTMTAIAFDSEGVCYSWDMNYPEDSYLYTVDLDTGEANPVGSLGVSLPLCDGEFLFSEDVLYITAYSPVNGSFLCTVDKETGEFTIGGSLENDCEFIANMFVQCPCCSHDVGVKSILKPQDGVAKEFVDVVIQVKSYEYNSENNVPVNVKILKENKIEEYSEAAYVDIPWNETINVEMPLWTPDDWQNSCNKKINYTIHAYTSYYWDDNSSNNYKNKTFKLHYGNFHDVGCTNIIGPETGPAQAFPINCTVKNYGQYEECCFKTHVEIAERDLDSQEGLIEQDFSDSQFPPMGWSTTHENWMYSESNYAGGSIGEARLNYHPTDYDVFRLNSPALDTSDYNLIEIYFKHFLNHSGCAYKLEVDISQDGENWTSVWEAFAISDIGPENITIFTNEKLGSTNYISFALNGSCLYENNWYLDDIEIKGYKTLEPEYQDYVCMSQIDPGEEKELEFDDWTPVFLAEEKSDTKIYLCKSWTNMDDPLDENPHNDLITKLIELEYFHDIGIKEIMGNEIAFDNFKTVLGFRNTPYPDTYMAPGSQEINATVENIGTFSEYNLSCIAEIYEYITNYTQGTLVYDDIITNINLESLGGFQFLEFDDYNFIEEGVYSVNLDMALETDDYPENNQGVLIIGVDDTPPIAECEIDPPEPDGDNGWNINPPNITITAHDPEIAPGIPGSGVGFIYYCISGGPWQTVEDDSYTFSVNANGDILIEYYVCDKVGNCASIGSILIHIDMIEPNIEEVQWEAYKEGFRWHILFTCTANDATSGMNRVEMFVDDEFYEIQKSNGPTYEFTILWENKLKEVVFNFMHYDNAGNCEIDEVKGSDVDSYSTYQNCIIKYKNPSKYSLNLPINITGPTYGRPGIEYIFCIEITDPEGDDIYYYWDWGDGTNTDWLGPYGSGEMICVSHTWSDEGLFTITVKAKDVYGNESPEFTHEILIEAKAPHLELNRPKRAIYFNNRFLSPFFIPIIIGDIQLWFWAEDKESGLSHVELYIDDELRETFEICPKSWDWEEPLFFKHEIKLIAYDNAGNNYIKTRDVWKFY